MEVAKNRAKIGAVNFFLEMAIGMLSEFQRKNREGQLDFNVKKDVLNDIQSKQTFTPNNQNHH